MAQPTVPFDGKQITPDEYWGLIGERLNANDAELRRLTEAADRVLNLARQGKLLPEDFRFLMNDVIAVHRPSCF